jgi:predicted small lipoprotein YifL
VTFRQTYGFVLLAAVVLILTACGQAGPTHAPGAATSASPIATSTPTAGPSAYPTPTARSLAATSPSASPTIVSTTVVGTPTSAMNSAAWIDLPSEFSVRTAAQATALAIPAVESEFAATHPHVVDVWLVTAREAATAENADLGENDDPVALVWWIDLDGDTFLIPSCPAPPAGVTQTTCGSSSSASVRIYASDGGGQGMGLGRSFTPVAETGGVSIPADAKLRTEGEAIAAVLQQVAGASGQLPPVDSLRLLNVQQWMQEQATQGALPYLGLPSDTPIWEVEIADAAIPVPCILLDTSKCVHDHAMVLIDAIDGNQLGIYSPPPSPATATP